MLEQSTISFAAGISKSGLVPIVHSIAPFLINRAYEQIKIDFGYQNLPGNIVSVGGSYDYAGLGSTHHCPEDINLVNNIPNINIIVPGNSFELNYLFKKSFLNKNCNYYRLSEYEHSSNIKVRFGEANIIQHGKKLNIIVVGPSLKYIEPFMKNIDANIIYMTTIKPFDKSLLKKLKIISKKWLIIENYYSGCLNEQLCNILKNQYYKIYNLSVPKNFLKNYGHKYQIDKKLGFDTSKIKLMIKKILNEK